MNNNLIDVIEINESIWYLIEDVTSDLIANPICDSIDNSILCNDFIRDSLLELSSLDSMGDSFEDLFNAKLKTYNFNE